MLCFGQVLFDNQEKEYVMYLGLQLQLGKYESTVRIMRQDGRYEKHVISRSDPWGRFVPVRSAQTGRIRVGAYVDLIGCGGFFSYAHLHEVDKDEMNLMLLSVNEFNTEAGLDIGR